jgi:hypothetical protein
MFFHVLSKPQRSLGDFAGAPLAARIELQAETFVGHWAGGAQADSVGAALVLSGGLYHFNFISSFRSFLILNVHPISSNHEDSEKSKKTRNTQKKSKRMTHPWHIPDTWHTSPNLKRKIPPTKNLGFQNQWIWPSCPPGCLPRNPRCSKVESCWSPRAIFQDPKALVFMAENLLFNGPKYEKNPPQRPQKPRPNHFWWFSMLNPQVFFSCAAGFLNLHVSSLSIPKLMIAYW